MKKLEPYPIALSLFFIFTVLYLVCVGIKLTLISFGIEGIWHMHKIWGFLLPGFSGMDSLSILIGLLEVSVGSYALGYILVPFYNFLIKKKIREHKIEIKPIFVRFKTLFITFALYFSILFTICLLYDLVVPKDYQMLAILEILLPGFSGLTFGSYLLGIIVINLYSAYTAFIFSKTLNYFEKSQLKNMKEIPLEEG